MIYKSLCDIGGKKGRGRGGGGGGNRGVRGVDFGLGIGFNSETPSQAAPSRSGGAPRAMNSVRTGVMAQFKNSFVAATPSSNSQSQAYPNKRPSLMGFVSGGTIGGDMGRTQSQTPPPAAATASLHNSSRKNPQRFVSLL